MNRDGLSIVIVAPEVPFPPAWGFGIRVFNLVRELSRTNRVTLLCYGDESDQRIAAFKESLPHVGLWSVPRRTTRVARRFRQLASIPTTRSFHLGALYSAEMQRAIDAVIATVQPDIVQAESSAMATFRFRPQSVVVVDEHNIESGLLSRVAHVESDPLRQAFTRWEATKVRREEAAIWRRVDACLVTSERDGLALAASTPAASVRVVANGVDLDYFQPAPGRRSEGDIVFVGTMNYRPNADAVRYFTRRVLPLIRARLRDATLTVVGQGVPPGLREELGAWVRFTGAVPDIRPYLARAGVVVVPLRVGGGTRLKVLEAMAAGAPVVSTPLGCEGLAVEDGETALLAESPTEFAAAVLRVLEDGATACRLAQNARRFVEAAHAWPAIAGDLEHFYHELLGARRGSAELGETGVISGVAV